MRCIFLLSVLFCGCTNGLSKQMENDDSIEEDSSGNLDEDQIIGDSGDVSMVPCSDFTILAEGNYLSLSRTMTDQIEECTERWYPSAGAGGSTLDFTINDYEYASSDPSAARIAGKGGEVRASIEINDFFVGQTIDVVDLGNGEGRALRMTFTGMEGACDVRNFTAGDGSTYKGSFGRVQIDGMQMNRGYLIVDALPN